MPEQNRDQFLFWLGCPDFIDSYIYGETIPRQDTTLLYLDPVRQYQKILYQIPVDHFSRPFTLFTIILIPYHGGPFCGDVISSV